MWLTCKHFAVRSYSLVLGATLSPAGRDAPAFVRPSWTLHTFKSVSDRFVNNKDDIQYQIMSLIITKGYSAGIVLLHFAIRRNANSQTLSLR